MSTATIMLEGLLGFALLGLWVYIGLVMWRRSR